MTGSPELYDRWVKFCPPGKQAKCFRDLMLSYSVPPRAYHNLVHIGQCLAELEAVLDQAIDPVALQTAIWFHDAVYDPKSTRNEEDSAWVAYDYAKEAGLPVASREKVIALILSTKNHADHADRDFQFLSDIDLSILGQPEEAFWDYERKIRIEYEYVGEPFFKRRRAEILQGFLSRPSIYFTDHFLKKYEEQARKNLHQSIERLTL